MVNLKKKTTVNASVLNVLSLTQSTEHPQSGSSALSVINGRTIAEPDSAIFMFVRIAIRMIKVMN